MVELNSHKNMENDQLPNTAGKARGVLSCHVRQHRKKFESVRKPKGGSKIKSKDKKSTDIINLSFASKNRCARHAEILGARNRIIEQKERLHTKNDKIKKQAKEEACNY